MILSLLLEDLKVPCEHVWICSIKQDYFLPVLYSFPNRRYSGARVLQRINRYTNSVDDKKGPFAYGSAEITLWRHKMLPPDVFCWREFHGRRKNPSCQQKFPPFILRGLRWTEYFVRQLQRSFEGVLYKAMDSRHRQSKGILSASYNHTTENSPDGVIESEVSVAKNLGKKRDWLESLCYWTMQRRSVSANIYCRFYYHLEKNSLPTRNHSANFSYQYMVGCTYLTNVHCHIVKFLFRCIFDTTAN